MKMRDDSCTTCLALLLGHKLLFDGDSDKNVIQESIPFADGKKQLGNHMSTKMVYEHLPSKSFTPPEEHTISNLS